MVSIFFAIICGIVCLAIGFVAGVILGMVRQADIDAWMVERALRESRKP